MSRLRKESAAAAIQHLIACDPDWAGLIERVGPCGLRPKPEREPYEALIRAVAYQQIHGRAAEAILGRFLALHDGRFPDAERILAIETETLRICGFSMAKIATLREIAHKTLEGIVPTRRRAQRMSDEALIATLTSLRGIGRWTVEMLLIFTLERPDVLPVDDFGVREGWRVLKDLPSQPTPKSLAETGQAWRPYRTVATWYLWRAAELGRQTRATD